MAFNQFSINSDTYIPAGSVTTFPSGNAILNSTLSSPLTGSTYCRQYNTSFSINGPKVASETKTFISSSVSSGNFVDTNNAYSLSLRAKVRSGMISNSTSNFDDRRWVSEVGLTTYSPISSGIIKGGGFCLALHNSGAGTFLVLRAARNTLNEEELVNTFAYSNSINCAGTYTLDTWYHIRLDVIALSLTQKRLLAYTSTDNGVTWGSPVGTIEIDSLNSNYRGSGNNGFYTYLGKVSQPINAVHYIDDFEAYVSIP